MEGWFFFSLSLDQPPPPAPSSRRRYSMATDTRIKFLRAISRVSETWANQIQKISQARRVLHVKFNIIFQPYRFACLPPKGSKREEADQKKRRKKEEWMTLDLLFYVFFMSLGAFRLFFILFPIFPREIFITWVLCSYQWLFQGKEISLRVVWVFNF